MTKRYKFTHATHCHSCNKEHYANRNKLVISLKDFRTYCADNESCKHLKEHLIPLDNNTIAAKLREVYPMEFAGDMEKYMQRTFSVRPSISMVYYLMQLSDKLKIGSWNGVLYHIVEEYMRNNPINIPIKESPFFNFQHSTFNDLVDNPFAVEGATITDVKQDPIEPNPLPKPEKPQPQPESQQPDDILTL